MRRPPEVVLAGLLVISLLGASGCAGFPQRSSGTSLWGAPSDGAPSPPPGLFSWWHRPASQASAAPTDDGGPAETLRPSATPVVAARPATNPWPETQSEWFARNFPRVNRLWNGTTTGSPGDGGDLNGRLQTTRTRPNPPVADEPVTASSPRSDTDVRPTDGASQDAAASSADRSGARAQYPDDLPYSPTAPPLKSPRQIAAEPVSEPKLDVTTPASAPQQSNQADDTDRAEPASWQQGDDSGSAKRSPATATGPSASPDRPGGAPQALEDILPSPPLADGPQAALATGRGNAAPTEASAGTVDPAGLTSDPAQAPISDTRMAQIPPAPPPVVRTPAPAAPAAGAATPPEPPAAAAPAAGSSPASATGSAPTPAAPSPTVGAAAPATVESQAPAVPSPKGAPAAQVVGSGQRPLAASGQSIYASPSPVAPAQPRHHLLGWLFHEEPSGPLASAQLPPATFPTTYSSPQTMQPTGQANAVACESPAKAPKKPCFLKVWIHDLKSGGHCSQGDGCGHGGVCASPQGNATECAAHAKAPKKPCFLKVWIHEWKDGHGAGCGGCQQGGTSNCCKCCKACGGARPVAASPQGGAVAAGQAGTTGVAAAQH